MDGHEFNDDNHNQNGATKAENGHSLSPSAALRGPSSTVPSQTSQTLSAADRRRTWDVPPPTLAPAEEGADVAVTTAAAAAARAPRRGFACLLSLSVVATAAMLAVTFFWFFEGDEESWPASLLSVSGTSSTNRRSGGPHAAASSGGPGSAGGQDEIQSEGQGGISRRYRSFRVYAEEQALNYNETLPTPIVASIRGPTHSLSLPVAIIMGVQKGGTQNMRTHLLTHPLLSGLKGVEAHFFDVYWPFKVSRRDEWPGDGHDALRLSPRRIAAILRSYAEVCMLAVNENVRDSMVTVDSTPLYAFHPLIPYRMKMVLPHPKLIVIVRDPTERYFSHLRMMMCRASPDMNFENGEEIEHTYFHDPGRIEEYLEKSEEHYQPYTPLCRGEKATATDLQRCWDRMEKYNALYRGLYADQLERWYRVYDQSQILVVESSAMFANFTDTLSAVTEHVGLPPHYFKYDSRHQHESNACEEEKPHLFAKGGRYDKMLEDTDALREWYRPHNQRLYELLGRELPWP